MLLADSDFWVGWNRSPADPRLRAFMDRRWGPYGRGPVEHDESPDTYSPENAELTDVQRRTFGRSYSRGEFDVLFASGGADDDALVLRGLELGHLDPLDLEGMLEEPQLLAIRWLATGDVTLLRALPWVPAGPALASAIGADMVDEPGRLLDLAQCGDADVALALIRSPRVDARLLEEIARRNYYDGIDFDLLKLYPNVPPAWEFDIPPTTGSVPEDPVLAVINHPLVSEATLAWLRIIGPRHIRAMLLCRPDCPRVESFTLDNDPLIRVLAYIHPDSSLNSDGAAASDFDRWVRCRVAEHPGTRFPVLTMLAMDEDAEVRRLVAENPRTHPWALERMDITDDEGLRVAMARNPAAPAPILLTLAADSSWHVREAVAGNPNAPAEALQITFDLSTGHETRLALASNARTPPALLQELAGHVNARIRNAAGATLESIRGQMSAEAALSAASSSATEAIQLGPFTLEAQHLRRKAPPLDRDLGIHHKPSRSLPGYYF